LSPDEVGFAVKPPLAKRMIERALPGLPEGRVRVAVDEVNGRDGAFRYFLWTRRPPYAVTVTPAGGTSRQYPKQTPALQGRTVDVGDRATEWVVLPSLFRRELRARHTDAT
jgi:hypothetical protein